MRQPAVAAVPDALASGQVRGQILTADDRTAKKTAVPQKIENNSYRKKDRFVPQKIQPIPQNFAADLVVEDDDETGFENFAGDSAWRVERRFYKKKNGDVMLYWNYRSRNPVYINGERKIQYKPGGKKLWEQKLMNTS
ncbi:MAG: hypothetical protein IPM39_23440 [Chloroflexi bacterium]|nr:hypothetical protein [Chloroflexota bacterium]